MNFLLPYNAAMIPNDTDIKYCPCILQSEDATTATFIRDLGANVWSANVITILKSYFTTVNIDGIDYDTIDINDVDSAVLSWM